HWRTSARRGMPFVREHEDDIGREAMIELDNRADASAQGFELAVSRTAALCVELVRRGIAVGLLTRGAEIPPGVGAAQLARLLRLLAFVAPESGARPRGRHRPAVRVQADGRIDLPEAPALRTVARA
ncbi:MAG TPA: DUF58 domain-containing protein, partial [Polyangia bacterium]|nr:DUF58 domain-containing protein [Polyangia bacterium]